jgi:hypothetical protein
MFRKLILSAVVSTATLAGFAAPDASAHERVDYHHYRRFEVVVWERHGWENRGVFDERWEAERRAEHLRHEGFRVEIREW